MAQPYVQPAWSHATYAPSSAASERSAGSCAIVTPSLRASSSRRCLPKEPTTSPDKVESLTPTKPEAPDRVSPHERVTKRARKAGASGRRPLVDIAAASEDMDPADFFERRKVIERTIKEAQREFLNKSGYHGKIKAAISRLGGEASVVAFKPNPYELVSSIQGCMQKIVRCSIEVSSATSGLLAEAERKALIEIAKLTSFRPDCKKVLEGLTVMVQDVVARKRAAYMQDRHLVNKVICEW